LEFTNEAKMLQERQHWKPKDGEIITFYRIEKLETLAFKLITTYG